MSRLNGPGDGSPRGLGRSTTCRQSHCRQSERVGRILNRRRFDEDKNSGCLFSPFAIGALSPKEPDRDRADVPVQRHRRRGQRLAPHSPRPPGVVGCRPTHRRGHRGRARGAHLSRRPGAVVRRDGGCTEASPDGYAPAIADAARDRARSCRPQDIPQRTVGWRPAGRPDCCGSCTPLPRSRSASIVGASASAETGLVPLCALHAC